MKKKTNKGMKKLLMSVMAMAIAIVGAATSTYAWFTMNATPAVGEFSVKVSSVQSLEIALDTRANGSGANYKDLNYKGFLNGYEIENWLGSMLLQDQLTLIPAQTQDGINFTDIYGGAAITGSDRTAVDYGSFPNEVTSEKAFFEFTLYFRTKMDVSDSVVLDMNKYGANAKTYVSLEKEEFSMDYKVPSEWMGDPTLAAELNTDDYIVLANDNKTILAVNVGKYKGIGDAYVNSAGLCFETRDDVEQHSSENNRATSVVDIVAGATPVGYAANAMRLSFSPIDIENDTNLNARMETDSAFIWDPRKGLGQFNDDVNVKDGSLHTARNFAYDMMLAERDDVAFEDSYFGGHLYNDDVEDEIVCDLTTASGGDYRYGAVTVRIWLDGWDAECFNGIMTDIANIALQFKMAGA